jgi:hypothetical protein
VSEPHTFTHGVDPSIPLDHALRHHKADAYKTYRARQMAGWTTNSAGWVSPCGMSEDEWAAEEYPFPEEPGFSEWFSAFYHYDAADEGVEAIPYPNALTE